MNPQRNANPGGQINKAIFLRYCHAVIPTSSIKRKIQQSVNFEKRETENKNKHFAKPFVKSR